MGPVKKINTTQNTSDDCLLTSMYFPTSTNSNFPAKMIDFISCGTLSSKMSCYDTYIEQRQHCWDARDQYWQCLDKNAPQHQSTSQSEEPKACLQFRKLFIKECPGQWVKHFDRKRTYEQFKEKMAKGYDPTDNKEEPK